MKNILIIIFVSLSVIACKNEADTDESTSNMEKSELEITCYSYASTRDTINMKIEKLAENVSGTLDIAYTEKDKNSGTFLGKMKGDTLSALYTFNSEGMQTTREIIFLVKKEQLLEGHGPLNAEGTHFENRNSITFSTQMPLALVQCED